jgi:hypothetical protein
MVMNKHQQAEWHKANPDKAKEYRSTVRKKHQENPDIRRCQSLRYRYGISLIQMRQMLEDQGGRCAICGTTEPKGRWNNWHVDHNHVTSKVRGILCGPCNVGLGTFCDNADILRKAADYLER